MGHKPFKVIAEYLSANGIAVLRYDERGVGSSEGDFKKATSKDFSQDAEAGFDYLKGLSFIDSNKIGFIGHSEGGLVAPMIAARNKDVNFLILLAGPALPGDEILYLQQEAISKTMGFSNEKIEKAVKFNKTAFGLIKTETGNKLKLKLRELFNVEIAKDSSSLHAGMSKDQFIDLQINQLINPWFKNFISYDPSDALRNVDCKVLALYGEKDLQVPALENMVALEAIVNNSNKSNIDIQKLASHNHLFQIAKSGSPMEYASIDHAISKEALQKIKDWIEIEVVQE